MFRPPRPCSPSPEATQQTVTPPYSLARAGQSASSQLPSRIRRGLLVVAGLVFTGLAAAGVLLPLVPTTPFLLLAAVSFARSSPRLYRWLLSNRHLGPYLEEWRRDRTIPRAAKRKAYLAVGLTFGLSIVLVDSTWLRLALLFLGSGVSVFIAWLPTSRGPREPGPPDG